MFYSVLLCLAVITAAAADVAHLGYNYEPPTKHSGYNYEPPTKHSGYNYDAPVQGAPTELHSEYVAAEFEAAPSKYYEQENYEAAAPAYYGAASNYHETHYAPADKVAASYVSAASAPAPVHAHKTFNYKAPVHFQDSYESAPAATHLHAVHESAPAYDSFAAPVHFQSNYESAPAATHLHAVQESAPVYKHFHESHETVPAASHQQSVLTSYDVPTFIDTNALSIEATNDVDTVYDTNGGYVY